MSMMMMKCVTSTWQAQELKSLPTPMLDGMLACLRSLQPEAKNVMDAARLGRRILILRGILRDRDSEATLPPRPGDGNTSPGQ